MTTWFLPTVISVSAVVAACNGGSAPTKGVDAGQPATVVTMISPAQAALDEVDTRTPVPLVPMMANHQKENMRDHLLAVQEIVSALAAKDFPAIEKAAGRIGYSEQMGQMCTHMGAGAPGFTEAALDFHRTADAIGAAAKKRDPDAVLIALNRTLTACTGCHATFKQHVVDEATWASLTNESAPSMPMSH